MNRLNKFVRFGFCGALMISSISTARLALSETVSLHTEFVQGAQLPQNIVYEGRLDGIGANGATVVVDDTVLALGQLVKLNGSRVPRDRLPYELAEGQVIEFELELTDQGQRRIVSITSK